MRIFGTSYAKYDEQVIKHYDLGLELGQFMAAAGLDRYEELKADFTTYLKSSPHLSMHGVATTATTRRKTR